MGGGPAYVRAHARAATRLGFEPHIFYAAPISGVVETDYGFIYQARSLLYNSFLQHGGIEVNKCLMRWLAPRVAAEVERFCVARKGPHLIHSFSAYGYAALLAGEGLKRRGVDATVINSVFTTAGHESRAKAKGARNSSNHLKWAVSKLEYAVIKRWITRYEGRAFAESRLVTMLERHRGASSGARDPGIGAGRRSNHSDLHDDRHGQRGQLHGRDAYARGRRD